MGKKFKCGGFRSKHKDDVVNINVQIRAKDKKGKYIKGNLIRTFTVADAKVSEVAEAIEKALFG